jgi:hypothetical protein
MPSLPFQSAPQRTPQTSVAREHTPNKLEKKSEPPREI